jgi:hypothetical protein
MNPVKSKKYDFDITVTDNTYAGELALPYVTAAVTGAETITNNRCRLIEGVVHKAVISNLGLTDVIQAADCGGSDGENTTLTEQVVTLNDLMVKETICRKTIFPTFIAAQGRMRRDGQIPPAFAEFLLSSVSAKAGQNLETLLWAGDAGAVWGLGLLSNDGVIDEDGIDNSAMGAFAQVTTAATFTAANILGEMDKVFAGVAATPGIMLKPGAGFYVSYEAYAFYLQAMAGLGASIAQSYDSTADATTITRGKGQGYENRGYNQNLNGASYLGYPVYPTAGIGTADAIAFTYPENIVVGTNAYTGNEAAALIPVYQYDGSDNVKATMNFAVGVNVAVPTDGVVGFAFTA